MAMEVVNERCEEEVDMGGQQELCCLVYGWSVGAEWVLGLGLHEGFWVVEDWEGAEKDVRERLVSISHAALHGLWQWMIRPRRVSATSDG